MRKAAVSNRRAPGRSALVSNSTTQMELSGRLVIIDLFIKEHVCGFVASTEGKHAEEGMDNGAVRQRRHANGGDVRDGLHVQEEEAMQMVYGVSRTRP